MADYNIFIIISKKYLQAGYYHNEGITPISIDGNLKITYSSDRDFEKLIDAIKDTFNIDELDDIAISALIICCGANRQNSDHLYNMIKKTSTHNLINAEIIIPYLCIYKTKLTQDKELSVSLLDSTYQIKKQTNNKFKCILSDEEDGEDLLSLELEDLIPLVEVDLSKIGIDEELEQYKNKTSTLSSDLAEKEAKIAFLEEQYSKSLSNLANAENKIKSLRTNIIFNLRNYFDVTNFDKLNLNSIRYSLSCYKRNGDSVEENETFASIHVYYEYKSNHRKYSKDCKLCAPASGMIIYNPDDLQGQLEEIIGTIICDTNELFTSLIMAKI